ncbi:DUF4013 domain-containing protein [archaeon]|nr:DUF4013 domain-containing protein [archaeon]
MDYSLGWDYLSRDWGETLKQSLFYFIINFLPVIGSLIGTGWMLRIIRQGISKKKGVPEVFKNVGDELIEGLKYTALVIIWTLPLIIITLLYIFTPSVTYSNQYIIILSIIFIILIVAYLLLLPLQTCLYAKSRSMGDFFKLRRVFKILSKNLGSYLVLLIVSFAYMILGFIPVIGSGMSLLAVNKLLGSWIAEKSK